MLEQKKSDLADRFKLLFKGASSGRKAFRVGKWLDAYVKLVAALKTSALRGEQLIFTAMSQFSMIMYYLLDNLHWLLSLKVIKWDAKRIKKHAARFRFTSAILNSALSVINYQKYNRKVTAMQKKGRSEDDADFIAARDKLHMVKVNLVKHGADVVTFGNTLEMWKVLLGGNLSDGAMGVFGSASAIAGGYAIWRKKI